MDRLVQKFNEIPRISLAPLETPIQELSFLKEMYPDGPQVFIKRDDFIGPMVWGNKLRKLEYTLAEAKRVGADTLITTGGIQSNHARTTAQVARQEDFDVVLVLNGEEPAEATGNFLISKILEADIYIVSDRNSRIPRMEEIAQNLRDQGKSPFLIPLGASDEIGSLGFIRGAQELKSQEQEMGLEFNYIFHASSSGGTQAGLLLGKKLFELKAQIVGISADSSYQEMSEAIYTAAEPIIKRLGANFSIPADDIFLDENYIGSGYGDPTKESKEAAKLLAKRAGVLLDQTYSAKAIGGLIDRISTGEFQSSDKVLFWHTGGTVALFR